MDVAYFCWRLNTKVFYFEMLYVLIFTAVQTVFDIGLPSVPAVLLACVLSFNVDQKNSLSFSGPLEDMFGYTVQQFENSEGKW